MKRPTLTDEKATTFSEGGSPKKAKKQKKLSKFFGDLDQYTLDTEPEGIIKSYKQLLANMTKYRNDQGDSGKIGNAGIDTDLTDVIKIKTQLEDTMRQMKIGEEFPDVYDKAKIAPAHESWKYKKKSDLTPADRQSRIKEYKKGGKPKEYAAGGRASIQVGGDSRRAEYVADMYADKGSAANISTVGGSALTGAASGAALGTAIAPGIGTAVGAVAGGIGGYLMGKAKSRKARLEARKRQKMQEGANIAMGNKTVSSEKLEDAVINKKTGIVDYQTNEREFQTTKAQDVPTYERDQGAANIALGGLVLATAGMAGSAIMGAQAGKARRAGRQKGNEVETFTGNPADQPASLNKPSLYEPYYDELGLSPLMMDSGFKHGGKISGKKGVDKIEVELDEKTNNGFVVPKQYAPIAEKLRKQYFPDTVGKKADVDKTNNYKKGGEPTIKVSDGEHFFSPEEAAYLTKMGVDLNKLAPNAEPGNEYDKGGKVTVKDTEVDGGKTYTYDVDKLKMKRAAGQNMWFYTDENGKEVQIDNHRIARALNEYLETTKEGTVSNVKKREFKSMFINSPAEDYDVATLQRRKPAVTTESLTGLKPEGSDELAALTPSALRKGDPGAKGQITEEDEALSEYERLKDKEFARAREIAMINAGLYNPNAGQEEEEVTDPITRYFQNVEAEDQAEAARLMRKADEAVSSESLLEKQRRWNSEDRVREYMATLTPAPDENSVEQVSGDKEKRTWGAPEMGTILGATQAAIGARSVFGKENERPFMQRSNAINQAVTDAYNRSTYGFTPERYKEQENTIQEMKAEADRKVVDMAGGNRFVAMTGINNNTANATKAMIRLNTMDEDIKEQKRIEARKMLLVQEEDRRRVENDMLSQFDKNQASSEALLRTGLENIIGGVQAMDMRKQLKGLRS